MSRGYDNYLRSEYEKKRMDKNISDHTLVEYIEDACNGDAKTLWDNILQNFDFSEEDIEIFCKERNLKNMDELIAKCENAMQFWESIVWKIRGWDWYYMDGLLLGWYGE